MLNKIFTNTVSQILSKAGTALISIVLISVLTNYLTLEYYGLYNKVYNYLGIFTFLADLGLYTITIREINKNKKDSVKIVSNVMSLRTLLGILIVFFALIIAYFLPGYNEKITLVGIVIVSLFSLTSLINSSILSFMQANLKIEFSMISAILGKAITFFGICFVAYIAYPSQNNPNFDFEIPFYFILIFGLFGVFVNTLLNYFYSLRISRYGFGRDFKYMLHIFKISLPYGIALFLSVVYFKIDVILLSVLETSPKNDISVALYSVPMKIIEVLMTLGVFYLNSILGTLTENFKNKNLKKLQKLFYNSFKILFSFGCFLLVMGSIFKNNIILTVANGDYITPTDHQYSSSDVFFIVLFVLLLYYISNLYIYYLIALNKEKKLLYINLIVAIFNIIGNTLVISKFSFMGAAIITVCSQALLLIICYNSLKKYFKTKISYLNIVANIIFGVIVYIFGTYLISNYDLGNIMSLIVYGGVLGVIYLGFFGVMYRINYKFPKN